jgi:glycosyltransferase involved in cell wall biosynthesis
LARNQRVISTHNGALGIDKNVCGDNLIVVDDNNWDDFANAVVQYINQPKHIPDAFYKMYSWSNIVNNLVKKLQ